MIKIVTDSSCDLSKDIIEELGITVVPLFARFGEEIFRDRVDISEEEFYEKLTQGKVFPVTIQPNPKDFVDAYEKLAKEADAIVSIHISSKLSGTLNSAFQAKDIVAGKTNIELVDSLTTTTGLGLVVTRAAKVAKEGGDLQQVLTAARESINNNNSLCLLDTLKYLEKGGRIGKAKALMGSLLNVKPIISIKDGVVVPFAQARSRAKGLDAIYEFVSKFKEIDGLAVAYSTTAEDAEMLAQRLQPLFKKGKIRVFRMGIVLGIHTGPGSMVVSVVGK